MNMHIRRLIYSAMFLAIALLLPFLTGQIPQIGKALCPMHIPVLLCGFVCGWPWGLAVGLIAPVLRSLIFTMPVMMPDAVVMAFELAVYGAVSGLLYRRLPRANGSLYLSLLGAMIAGRLVWGAARYFVAGLQHTSFDLAAFWAGAVATALPGIVLQLVLIPPLVWVLRRAGLTLNESASQ
ncbi:MAG: ECF transporter S component [Clostridia bacterium]|nr:ECF transporter S component [Clostridia bacterium]